MRVKLRVARIAVTSFLTIAALTGCSLFRYHVEEVDYASPPRPAAILIGDPQVFSRASLINDRRLEAEYLDQLLENSRVRANGESPVKFTPQIVRDLKTVEVLSASLGLSLGKNISDATPTSALSDQVNATKLQIQLAILQKQLEGINASAPPAVSVPAPDVAVASAASTAATSSVSWPDTTALRAAITAIQTQLASLANSSAAGPTAPSNNYGVLHDPRDDFIDRQAYRRDIRASLAEARLDNTHDRGGNALYRLQFQATVLPPSGDSRQWGVAKMSIAAPTMSGRELRIDYIKWLTYLSTKLNEGRSAIGGGSGTSDHDLDFDRFVTRIGEGRLFTIIDLFIDEKGKPYCFFRKDASDKLLIKLAQGKALPRGAMIEGTYVVPLDVLKSGNTGKDCADYSPNKLFVELAMKLDKAKYDYIRTLIRFDRPRSPAGTQFPSLRRESSVADAALSNVATDNGFLAFCAIVTGLAQDRCKSVADEDVVAAIGGKPGPGKADYAVRAYSVLPGELVQRLGTTTESSQSLQTALSVAGRLAGPSLFNADIGYLRQSDVRAEGLTRQPLVVGFAGSEKSIDPIPATPDRSYFGWLFGPRYEVKDEKSLGLRQTVRNYGVNADVSVPGWWKSITLDVDTEWVQNWSEGEMKVTSPTKVSKLVNLPLTMATYEALTNFVALKQGDLYTRIFASYVVPNVVPTCASTMTFQVGGLNIWRADNIFLGGSRAKNIRVLPDMNGVAADFDLDEVFGKLAFADHLVQVVPLTVMAEQGPAAPLSIHFVGKRQSANGATTCQSPLLLPTLLRSLPPTIASHSPTEVCSDVRSIPLVIRGLNLPRGNEDSNVGKIAVGVVSEYFKLDGQNVSGDETQLFAKLVRNDQTAEKLPLTKQKLPIALNIGNQSLSVSVEVRECKSEIQKPPVATLLTKSVTRAKDQKITLALAIPEGYADLIVSVRPKTDKDDYIWSNSDSIKNAIPGKASEVSTTMDLSTLPGDKLDVRARIRYSPVRDWTDIDADKPLPIASN